MTLLRIVSTIFVLAALAGCSRENPDVDKVVRQAERQVERAAVVLDDAAITAKVKSALIADSRLSGLSIDVDTTKNIVTLRGTVASDELRRHAEDIARKIEGVTDVKNDLSLKPA